jgi:hypothetical protein
MRTTLRDGKMLRLSSVLLALAIGAVGFWQYSNAEAVRIDSRGGYISLDAAVASVRPSSPLDAYTGSEVTEKSSHHYEIDYPGSGGKIGIGDSASNSFKPDLSITTWNGEAGFKLVAPPSITTQSPLSASLAGDTVSASNGEWAFQYKPVEPKAGFNDRGGLDIFITVKERPASDTIEFTFASTTVTPYFQPALTEQYKDGPSDEFKTEIKVSENQVVNVKDGTVLVERPDYVVNSIAFFADNRSGDMSAVGGINYRAGKVGHLYRMKATDKSGNSAWMDWSMPSGTQLALVDTIGILQKGDYPVTIAPAGDTFGYTTVGGSTEFWGYEETQHHRWIGNLYTTPSNLGPISKLTYYSYARLSTGTWAGFKGEIASHGADPHYHLWTVTNGIGNLGQFPAGEANRTWVDSTFSSSPNVSASTDYVVVATIHTDETNYYQPAYFDVVGTNQGHEGIEWSGAPGDLEWWNHFTKQYSIYATYTPVSTISSTPSSRFLLWQ